MGKASKRKEAAVTDHERFGRWEVLPVPGLMGRASVAACNQVYQVLVRPCLVPDMVIGGKRPTALWHLSIRRNDRRVIRDWRHFQRIKSELIGPDAEALELYPAESRLIDEANQFHLWVVEGVRLPFGPGVRMVSDPEPGLHRQRAFTDDPPDPDNVEETRIVIRDWAEKLAQATNATATWDGARTAKRLEFAAGGM